MKLWLISQSVCNDYDTYDAAVVVAETAEQAIMIHPNKKIKNWDGLQDKDYSWCNVKDVQFKLIGEALAYNSPGVILSSYTPG